MQPIIKMLKDVQGATTVEYAAIASLISIAAITAIATIGIRVSALFGTVPAF